MNLEELKELIGSMQSTIDGAKAALDTMLKDRAETAEYLERLERGDDLRETIAWRVRRAARASDEGIAQQREHVRIMEERVRLLRDSVSG